jgi:hypothetical protein
LRLVSEAGPVGLIGRSLLKLSGGAPCLNQVLRPLRNIGHQPAEMIQVNRVGTFERGFRFGSGTWCAASTFTAWDL